MRKCLPIVKQTSAELRATYLALHGLFPDKALLRLYLVVGAGNSCGTAGPGAQVVGLEVLCNGAGTSDALRTLARSFYAHETVHVLEAASSRPATFYWAACCGKGRPTSSPRSPLVGKSIKHAPTGRRRAKRKCGDSSRRT